MIDVALFVSPIVTALVAFAGSYLAFSTKLAKMETKIDVLSNRVEKHNSIVERTFKLESDMSTMWHRHDELKDDLEKVKDKIS